MSFSVSFALRRKRARVRSSKASDAGDPLLALDGAPRELEVALGGRRALGVPLAPAGERGLEAAAQPTLEAAAIAHDVRDDEAVGDGVARGLGARRGDLQPRGGDERGGDEPDQAARKARCAA
jgi:hypothetical protein